jgi:ferric-dicitrate binding protein FerR (iron transport regulator)
MLRRFWIVALLAFSVATMQPAAAQTDACALSPDPHDSQLQVLTCGDGALVVREAEGAAYVRVPAGNRPPEAIDLQAGAVFLLFRPSPRLRTFKVLTPVATAAVRGTRWAVELKEGRMSTLVLQGRVAVTPAGARSLTLGPGDGVDIDPNGPAPVVKKWAAARVQALLARFGE